MPTRSVLWFRRDLRLNDNPALVEAARTAPDGVIALFVVDPNMSDELGAAKSNYLDGSLQHLDAALNGSLHVAHGDPAQVVPDLAASMNAAAVHIAADFTPYGIERDSLVEAALTSAGRTLTRTGSPYAVDPGQVVKSDGSAYRVYSPFYREWLEHRWSGPILSSQDVPWLAPPRSGREFLDPPETQVQLPEPGEEAALTRWRQFLSKPIHQYATDRNRPDLAGTSRMSISLRFGEVHPRTLLADLGGSKGHEVYRKELAWREFYADVLYRLPATEDEYMRREFADMEYDTGPTADERLEAWKKGRTGYPMVDAGMRQLVAEGWMHNRVRMLVASFLVKDLHLEWQAGAQWFMEQLADGDVASNSHGWQWTAGCGTDPAPYFRIFNPVTQGMNFDPHGAYVREFVPELDHLKGNSVHEPWKSSDGYVGGYPHRIVDHAKERKESLSRYSALGTR